MREISLLVSIYSIFFHLYPRAYQQEYRQERLEVFELALQEAARGGRQVAWRLFLGELMTLPGSALQQHLRAGRSKGLQDLEDGWQAPVPWSHLAVPGILFILLISDRTLDGSPAASELGPVFPLLILFLLLGLLVSIFSGFPRWSIPIAGLVLGGLAFFAWAALLNISEVGNWLYFLKPPPGQVKLQLIHAFFTTGFQWMAILAILATIFLASAVIPPNRRFWRAMLKDWTLAAFLIYCVTPFILIMNFDDYRYQQVYIIPVLLILAVGTLLFLRTSSPGRRLLALTTCLTLAMFIAIGGLWNLIPLQTWAAKIQPVSLIGVRQLQTVQEAYNWFWILTAMLLVSLPGLVLQPQLRIDDKVA